MWVKRSCWCIMCFINDYYLCRSSGSRRSIQSIFRKLFWCVVCVCVCVMVVYVSVVLVVLVVLCSWCVSELCLCVSEYMEWTAWTNYYVRFLIRGSAKNESSSTLSVRFTLVFWYNQHIMQRVYRQYTFTQWNSPLIRSTPGSLFFQRNQLIINPFRRGKTVDRKTGEFPEVKVYAFTWLSEKLPALLLLGNANKLGLFTWR